MTGFNEARLREIIPGSLLSPDEMMMEWRGKSGFGGTERWGRNLKVCVRVRWGCAFISKDYGATTACTVCLLDCLNISELGELIPPQRCVFADSWFASVATVVALRTHLGLAFTGPVKTAHSNFPIEAMRFTLSKLQRGDFIVSKCHDVPNLWAVGWHDHHFKCYITTHGVTTHEVFI